MWRQVLQDVQWAFTTIAVLLGTGILGLPVKLATCGFWPFLAVLTLTFFMQVATVVLVIDVVQRGARRLDLVDMHTLGKTYANRAGSALLDACVLLNLTSALVSYALAGSQAFGELSGASVQRIVTPFVLACTTAIIFFSRALQPVISLLTGVKVVILIFVIGAVGIVASRISLDPHSAWSDSLEPFLVGTVAIGGMAQYVPVIYPRAAAAVAGPIRAGGASSAGGASGHGITLSRSSSDVALATAAASASAAAAARPGGVSAINTERASLLRHFRWSIVTGIFACYVLNLVWSRFVLGIVPQTEADAAALGLDVSLASAAAKGQIATIPLSQVIQAKYPQYSWVQRTASAFITLSITVSFNALGLGLKHVLDGMAMTIMGACARASCGSSTGAAGNAAAISPAARAELRAHLMRYSGVDHGHSASTRAGTHAPDGAGGSSWFDDDELVTAQYRIMASTGDGSSGGAGNKLAAAGPAGEAVATGSDANAPAGTEAVPGESTSLLQQQSPAFEASGSASRPGLLAGIVTHARTSSMVSDGSDPSTPSIAVPVLGGPRPKRTAVQSCMRLARAAAVTVFDPRQAAATVRLILHNPAARVMFGTRAALYILAFGVILGVALGNPQGFVLVLEIFTSLALNMSNGVIVSAMSDAAVAMDDAAEAALATDRRGAASISKRGAGEDSSVSAADRADVAAAGGSASGGRPASGSLDAYLMPADAVSRMSYQTVDFSDSEEGVSVERHQHIMQQLHLGLSAGRTSPQVGGAGAGDLSGEFGPDGLAHDAAVPRGGDGDGHGQTASASAAAAMMQPIALPLPTWFRRACSVFCMYTFIGAVLYDAYTALERVAPPHSAMFWTIGLGLLFWRYTVYAAFHARMRALLGLPARGFKYDASASAAPTTAAPAASLGAMAAAVTKQSPKTLLQWLVKDPWQCAVSSFAICISAGAATLLREADAGLIGLVVPTLVLNEVVCPLVRVVADSSHHFFSLATCLRAGLMMGGVIASAVNGGDAAIALFSVSFALFLALSCLRVAPLLCRCGSRQ